MTRTIEIANTIKHQINAQSPMALMSYAARDFVALSETNKRHGGLQFKVSGHKHKGLVLINLAFNDTYTVEAVKIRKGSVTICNILKDVYADQLIEVLDNFVEGVEYAR